MREDTDLPLECLTLCGSVHASTHRTQRNPLLSFPAYLPVHQAQAVAYALRTAALEAGPGASIVAIVNLGTLATLRRNWEVRGS